MCDAIRCLSTIFFETQNELVGSKKAEKKAPINHVRPSPILETRVTDVTDARGSRRKRSSHGNFRLTVKTAKTTPPPCAFLLSPYSVDPTCAVSPTVLATSLCTACWGGGGGEQSNQTHVGMIAPSNSPFPFVNKRRRSSTNWMDNAAGLIIYRVQNPPEFLLLHDTYSNNKHWSPPKG